MELAEEESFSLQRGFELAEREGISVQRQKIEQIRGGGGVNLRPSINRDSLCNQNQKQSFTNRLIIRGLRSGAAAEGLLAEETKVALSC